jgi:pimeloyl-ACP methyl ester carboxylesterase
MDRRRYTLSTFVLVPGAGGASWYWHRVAPELEERGHTAVTVDLPGPDENAGLPEYAEAIGTALDDHRDAVVVAQSLTGFSAPMACVHHSVGSLVLVNAMIPLPGETPGAWWDNTGAVESRIRAAAEGGYPDEFDVETYFLHDVPSETAADGESQVREEAAIAFGQPCDITRWPDVPTRVLVGRDDRFFPLAFQRRIARERLDSAVEVVPGGHLVALSRPVELVDSLTRAAPVA